MDLADNSEERVRVHCLNAGSSDLNTSLAYREWFPEYCWEGGRSRGKVRGKEEEALYCSGTDLFAF